MAIQWSSVDYLNTQFKLTSSRCFAKLCYLPSGIYDLDVSWLQEDISEIFRVADKDKSGTLTVKEIQDILHDIYVRYPQVQLYLKSKQMNGIADLVRSAKGDAEKESMELNIAEFKKALALVDSQVKFLPATAQVVFYSSSEFQLDQ